MIAVENLVKRYGARTALHGLTFGVGKGEIVGFLGPNGAGKSTTLRILAGSLVMTSGHVLIGGLDISEHENQVRALTGYMPEAAPLYPEMRVAEYLGFRADLKGIARGKRRARIGEAMERTQLIAVANVTVGSLSKGFRQRVGLADALLAKPPLLILDEPTAGLDPNQVLEVRRMLASLGSDHTVLISTHILSEVEAVCSKAIVIHKGRLVAEGSLAEMRKRAKPRKAMIVARGDAAKAEALLRALSGVKKVACESLDSELCSIEVRWAKDTTAPESIVEQCIQTLVTHDFGIREVSAKSSLEAVFAELTQSEAATEDLISQDPAARNPADESKTATPRAN